MKNKIFKQIIMKIYRIIIIYGVSYMKKKPLKTFNSRSVPSSTDHLF